MSQVYNKYGAMVEPFNSTCDKIGSDAAQKLIDFCEENNLSPEDITICFYYVQQAISCRASEHKLQKAMTARKQEKLEKRTA